MKPILVHVHIFYPSIWPELRHCLKNIAPHPYKLHVTLVKPNPELEADIAEHFPGATIELVENAGYDVLPFLHVLQNVNPDDYSYIIKLHTKRNCENNTFRDFSGSMWREHLLAFLSSPERFRSHLNAFEENPRIGMQADYHLLVKRDIYDQQCKKMRRAWLSAHRLPNIHFEFVAGSMFIARASLLKILLDYEWKESEFRGAYDHTAQMSQVVERLFGYFIFLQGYLISDRQEFKASERYQRRIFLMRIIRKFCRFFFQSKHTNSDGHIIKVLKIPVYRKRKKN